MSTNKSIARSAGVIGAATFASRILGFARDIIIARLFGIYVYAQAFVIAFKIPNLFRDFLGEGATNAAFVPVFSEYAVKHSKEEFWHLANVVLNLLLVALSILTIAGVLFAPLIVRLIAPGFIVEPDKLEATIRLTRLIFPYILLIGLAAYSMGILNSLKHFSVPAFAPCLLNISIIIFAQIFSQGITGLALGVLVGGFLQLAVQIPVLCRKGMRLRLFKSFRHPAAFAIGRLMLPRLFSSTIYQLNNFVDSIFGSLSFIVGEGGVAVLYFSYRLIQFPIGIFSNALSQAMLPSLSAQAAQDEKNDLKHTLSFGIRATFLMMLPASFGLMSLAKPIISVLFQGGQFDAASTEVTSSALFFYSIGLFAYGAKKVVQSAFFALKDTLTPARVAFIALVINIVLNAVLMFPLKIAGLALATSLSGMISFLILFLALKKRLAPFNSREIVVSFLRIFFASIAMALVCYTLSLRVSLTGSVLDKAFGLGILLFSGLASYLFFCFIFRVGELAELRKWIIARAR